MSIRRSTAALLAIALLLVAGAVGIQFAAAPESVTDWTMDDLRSDPAEDDETAADLGSVDRSEVADVPRDALGQPLGGANAPSRTLRGRVVDPGGAPVATAEVRLRLLVAGRSVNRDEAVNRPVKTGRDGAFAFRGPLAGVRSVAVTASHPDYAVTDVQREIPPGGEGDIVLGDVILTVGGIVTGTVMSADRVGLVDAVVDLSPQTGPSRGSGTQSHSVRTTGGGSFRIERVGAGAYRITARAPRMLGATSETFTVRDGTVTAVPPLALGAGCALDGLVTDRRGTPVAGARVWLNPDRAGPTATGETGPDGRFTLDHLARGPGRLQVQKAGFVTHQGRIDLTTSERATVTLEDGLRITGTVRDAETGQALTRFAVQPRRLRALASRNVADVNDPGPSVNRVERESTIRIAPPARRHTALELWREQVQALPKDPGEARPHPDGTFDLPGLDEGVWVIDVGAPDRQLARSEPIELVVGRPNPSVDLVLGRGHSVSGRVLGPDGSAIAGALAELMLMPPPEIQGSARTRGVSVRRATTSPTGEFTVRNAPAGWCAVAVSAKGHEATTTAPFELRADVADLAISLGARARIVGRVLGAPPDAATEVTVVAIAAFRNVTSRAAEADGTFVLEDLKPGPFHVRAYHCDGREATRHALAAVRGQGRDAPPDLVLVAGETRQLDVAVQTIPVGRVTGHVRRNGAPAYNYAVRLTRHASQAGRLDDLPEFSEEAWIEGVSLPSRAIEADGSFTIPDVEVGQYWLRVQAPGRGASEIHREAISVVADQTTHVEVAVATGGIDGEVVAPEVDTPPLQGSLRLFRDASSVPTDIDAWELEGRVRHVRFRAGRFAVDDIPVGSYLVEVRAGRERGTALGRIDVAAGVVIAARLTAGAKTEAPTKGR